MKNQCKLSEIKKYRLYFSGYAPAWAYKNASEKGSMNACMLIIDSATILW